MVQQDQPVQLVLQVNKEVRETLEKPVQLAQRVQ
jgi:hypothetical protein